MEFLIAINFALAVVNVAIYLKDDTFHNLLSGGFSTFVAVWLLL